NAVFLDRDGVINEVCYDDDRGIYTATTLDECRFLPKVKEAIMLLKKNGYLVIVVSNQPGVAFGYLKKEVVQQIDLKLKKLFHIDGAYYCFHHPRITGECECRKPKSGLLQQAASDFDINLKESFMVGDNLSDIEAGKACKKTFLIGNHRCDLCTLCEKKNIKPDFIVEDLYSAAKIITSMEHGEEE
nr:HAD-IIIA family hydrolase [Candidatus Sigynarchaeota archaeon]